MNTQRKSMLSNLLATFIFFSPNFLLLIPAIENSRAGFLIYNFIILFLLTSTVSNLKFNSSTNKNNSPTVIGKYRKV